MRPCASSPRTKGFTLLEMALVLAISGSLVGLLVAVWIQVIRTASTATQYSQALRKRAEIRRELREILAGAKWTSSSLAPDGALAWWDKAGTISLWSRVSVGASPGPARWFFDLTPEGLQGTQQDPFPGGSLAAHHWPEIDFLRLEVLQTAVGIGGEEATWIPLSQWDPAVPFRPSGVRLWVHWLHERGGADECIQEYP